MAKSKIKTPFPEEGLTQWESNAETEPQTGDPDRNVQYLAKGGVVGDSKDEYVPDVPNQDKNMPHFFAGTPDVGDDDFSVNTGDSGTIKGTPLNPASVPEPVIPTPQPAQVAAPAALAPKAQSNPNPLPGIPPEGQDDTLKSFLDQQKAGLEKYGPEQQMAVEQALVKARTGLGPSLAAGAGGLADAIESGVARASPTHFQENIQNQGNQLATEIGGTMEKAQTGKMAQMKAEMELSQSDPNSPISRIAQKANASTLIEAGVPKEAVKLIPANLIAEIGNKNVTLLDDRAKLQLEQVYRMAGLDLQAQTLRATMKNQQAERQFGAAKESAGQGIWKKATSLLTPSGRAAQAALQQQVTGVDASTSPVNHSAAMQWAQENPNDPKAKVIMQRAKQALGAQ